jgi:hypothetical protein
MEVDEKIFSKSFLILRDRKMPIVFLCRKLLRLFGASWFSSLLIDNSIFHMINRVGDSETTATLRQISGVPMVLTKTASAPTPERPSNQSSHRRHKRNRQYHNDGGVGQQRPPISSAAQSVSTSRHRYDCGLKFSLRISAYVQ